MAVEVRLAGPISLVLVLCCVVVTTSPSYHGGGKGHKQCVRPEECCRHPRPSLAFTLCCRDHGCCPLTCSHTTPPVPIEVEPEECEVGWECCRFRKLTQEYDDCCQRHGCCPSCELVSPGCCYNGEVYGYGVVVEEEEEACVQLVCGARTSPTYPFLTASLVVTRREGEDCDDATDSVCGETCLPDSCVDETWLARWEGETWKEGKCRQCRCEGGLVRCELDSTISCSPPPQPHCRPVPGASCCPEYNCSRGCVDPHGVFREEGSEWTSPTAPCFPYYCEAGIITKRQKECEEVTSPPSPQECVQYTPPGECCPKWNCSCVDPHGVLREDGSEWISPLAPCFPYYCEAGIITKRQKECEELTSPPSPQGCVQYTPPGECCPKWNCSGCVDPHGVFREEGSEWTSPTAPCFPYYCEAGIITKRQKECEEVTSPPSPQECVQYTPPGECCPKWNCSCVDPHGVLREDGSEWISPLAPCFPYYCEAGIITKRQKECEELTSPPSPQGCVQYTPPGECCPKWNCSGCVDPHGVFREEGSEWTSPTAPCFPYYCEAGIITKRQKECEEVTSPPSPQECVQYTPPGECCPKWNCSCVDPHGVLREDGSEWISPLAPCFPYYCEAGIITKRQKECEELTSPPSPQGCVQYTPPGECCPKWNCSGCVDPHGVFREEGSEWTSPTAPCFPYYCEAGIITKRQKECEEVTSPPSPQECVQYTPPGECCPKWNCSCVDPHGVLREDGSEWISPLAPCFPYYCEAGIITKRQKECEELTSPPSPQGCVQYTPPGECCPKWNCSGCVDPHGVFREEGSEWTSPTAPCFPYYCEAGIITKRQKECEEVTSPPSPQECVQYTPPGECCPKWNCSCVDPHGVLREDGSEWISPLAPCFPYYCEAGIITKRQKECEELTSPPSPQGCVQYTPPGECCPKWNCSRVCVDKFGKFHDEGSHWVSSVPCHVNICEDGSVVERKADCPTITPRPRPNCFQDTPDGECCPRWNCSGCVDSDGMFRPLGEVWQTSECISHECRNTGLHTTKEDCKLPTQPHPNCHLTKHPDSCCQAWNCSTVGCIDSEGKIHKEGNTWPASTPCFTLICNNSKIDTVRVTCEDLARPPLSHGCQQVTKEGECCPSWICQKCVDEAGVTHEVGDVWLPDPCTRLECGDDGEVRKSRRVCPQAPSDPTCTQTFLRGECCPKWICTVGPSTISSVNLGSCVDQEGQERRVGEQWSQPGESCQVYHCERGGFVFSFNKCPPSRLRTMLRM
ncbi:hypothetical protein Pmani_032012 [Petrolisthes manimaculis]|uniref:VWFC domain-containing protein n=1 Tax=Petrolisthes manimaculis TaxID=1843537 RepID=A0AAE1NTW4_9EUCA|nr:hypothetical protein Pmani_032012 [Petrolisthes manimaculis]